MVRHESLWRQVTARSERPCRLLHRDVRHALVSPKPLPDLPNVPLAASLAKTEEARQLIHAGIIVPSEIGRLYALPPGTPADRVQTLRAAFVETMRDLEFLADTKRSKLEIDPINGEELTRVVQSLFALDPAIAAKLKGILT